MSEKETKYRLIFWMVLCLIWILMHSVACWRWEHDVNTFKAKTVELGAAEWKVDSKTGKTTFTWKEAKP